MAVRTARQLNRVWGYLFAHWHLALAIGLTLVYGARSPGIWALGMAAGLALGIYFAKIGLVR